MREERLITRVKVLIDDYKFDKPFSNYLREYFRKHPEMGSTDRRLTREWCFNHFRIGINLKEISFPERLAVACFICSKTLNPALLYLLEKYTSLPTAVDLSLTKKIDKILLMYKEFSLHNVFPMYEFLSPSIDHKKWFLSFLDKPNVWIRVRKKFRNKVIDELSEKKIKFIEGNNPLAFSFLPEIALEQTDSYSKGYFEIQDINSQETSSFFKPSSNERWWDACSGSGGKSLLLKEENNSVHIFATDSRVNILENYDKRMKKAGYRSYETQPLDFTLSSDLEKLHDGRIHLGMFDGIIADVPCSGSGTWARSPERNFIDHKSKLHDHFIPLQRRIVMEAIKYLKPDCPLIYITCSVFSKENEENVRFFLDELPLQLEKMAYLDGYTLNSDTLFIARFIRK